MFGASFNENFEVVHAYADKTEDLEKFRGSKYVQSDIGNTYRKAKEFLDDGKYVLFTGTPCQIEGLKRFLGREYDKLYLQDIICHGVPAPIAWKAYREYREKCANSELKSMSFRSKHGTSWSGYHVNMKFNNDNEYDIRHEDDSYMKAFLSHLSLRESCTDCKFKKENRLSDITLADFWGIQNVKPDMDDGKGTSLVIVNSDRGMELMNEIKDKIISKEVNFQDAIKGNPSFCKSSNANDKQQHFFLGIEDGNFEDVVCKLVPKTGFISKAKCKIKKIITKINSKSCTK